jgi:hypothetical protein
MTRYALLLCLLGAACGDDDGTASDGPPGSVDAPPGTVDGPPGAVDAPPGTIDGPPAQTVECGTASCDVGTQHCCVEAMGGTMSFTCVDLGTACAGTDIGCDGPEDCEGAVCCAQTMGMSFQAVCAGACMGGGEVVCHDMSTCEAGQLCCDDPAGFSYCFTGDTCPG